MMPDIQVAAEQKRAVLEAHRLWSNGLAGTQGQIGSAITSLIEAPAVYVPGEITAYSDFDPIRFIGVDSTFVDLLRARGVPFQFR